MFIFWDDCNGFVPLWNTISQQWPKEKLGTFNLEDMSDSRESPHVGASLRYSSREKQTGWPWNSTRPETPVLGHTRQVCFSSKEICLSFLFAQSLIQPPESGKTRIVRCWFCQSCQPESTEIASHTLQYTHSSFHFSPRWRLKGGSRDFHP